MSYGRQTKAEVSAHYGEALSNQRHSVGAAAVEYRLYLLDRAGRIYHSDNFVSENDDAAMAHARELSAGRPAELWQYARVVGKLAGVKADSR